MHKGELMESSQAGPFEIGYHTIAAHGICGTLLVPAGSSSGIQPEADITSDLQRDQSLPVRLEQMARNERRVQHQKRPSS
jgi:hypothetical protein